MYSYETVNDKFIYVFDVASKVELLRAGYKLITEDPEQNVFVFANSANINFALNNITHVMTNTLTFK